MIHPLRRIVAIAIVQALAWSHDMTQILWIVDRTMRDRSLPTGQPWLAEAARREGHDVLEVRFRSDDPTWMDELPDDPSRPVVCVGPHQGIAAIQERFGDLWSPCAFHEVDSLTYTSIAAHWRERMLNADHRTTTWGELLERISIDHPAGVFVRPDAETKAFAGGVVRPGDLVDGSETGRRLSGIDPATVVVVAPVRTILGESRFVIVDGQVVSGSTYRWSGRLDVRSDVHPLTADLAAEVAAGPWQPDAAYVCDVAVVDGGVGPEPRIVEMNLFSTSGLYACDTIEVVRAVSRAASRIHDETLARRSVINVSAKPG